MKWTGPRTGHMSYNQDPSLRYHMSGPVEPMDYGDTPSIVPKVRTLGVILAIILWRFL